MPIVANKYRGSKEYMLVFSELLRAARCRGTLTYQDIAHLIGLPLSGSYMGSEIGHLVGEISEDEHNNGRPMLSAIVVSVRGKPGSGFFELAKLLGVLDDESEQGQERFWVKTRESLYQEWGQQYELD